MAKKLTGKMKEKMKVKTKAKVKENENTKKRSFQIGLSIKMQLLVGFLVPIFFVILVGSLSYKEAEKGMASNYEDAARTAIETEMQYLDFGLSLINSDAVQMKLDAELSSLVSGTYKNDISKYSAVRTKALSSIKVKQTSNTFINNMYIVPKSTGTILTSDKTSGKEQPGFYEKWIATEEGTKIASGETSGWLGYHKEMDALSGYHTEDYILSYVTEFPNKAAVLVVDISAEAVRNTLQTIDTSNGSIIGFITPDGRELVIKEDGVEDIVFSEQEFFKECMAKEELSGTEYVKYNDKDYFFIYSRSEKTGATLGYLVPKENIVESAEGIKKLTVVLVIVACIVALIIGTFISVNISSSMSYIIKKLKKAAEGDLTVELRQKGKTEFSVLSKNVKDMITNTRKLIQEVGDSVSLVASASSNVEDISVQMETSAKGIKDTIAEIDKGVSQQAFDAQDCLTQMDSLSQKIENISSDMSQAEKNSELTKEIIARSIETMEILTQQSKATTEVTEKVKEDIKILEKKSAVIGGFVNIINDIAGQTNLLSLNASIEAARAGEAGRGFSVVAEEIRKLADGSLQAANEINKVVEEITKQTGETVATANEAEKIVGEQAETVAQTKEDFRNINNCTEQLIENIRIMVQNLESMNADREETLNAIESISSVSEETAAASSNVSSITQSQMDIVKDLKIASEKLNDNMGKLEEALSLFTIE